MQTSFACGRFATNKTPKQRMAIYHLSVKTISRSAGRSATAAAAYRTASRIVDERSGELHDYTRRGGVESAELILPENAPDWAADRAALWNAAEQAETRKNSTVAREFEIALPAELSETERQRLAHDFAREIVERHGCAADVAIHAPGREGDRRNHHAHILCSTRRLGPEGFTEKTRELDDRKTGEVDSWRARFAELQNQRYRELGLTLQVDRRSLEAQGISDREATQHQGPAITGLLRRGEASQVQQRRQEEANARLFAARELGQLERDLAETERQLIDTTTDLATAIRERDTPARVVERHPGLERSGPALNSARFKAKPPAIVAGQGKSAQSERPQRPNFEAMPIEQQAQAYGVLLRRMAENRKAQLERIAGKAAERATRRNRTARRLWDAKPQRPSGLLAGFKQKTYETELAQWRQDQQRAGRIAHKTLYDSFHQRWAEETLKKIEPELTRRVRGYLAEQQRQAQEERAWRQLEWDFRDMAAGRKLRGHGWDDNGQHWQVTPKPLQDLIETYNRQSPATQARTLERLQGDPERAWTFRSLMEQRREKVREREYEQGISR